MIKCIILDIHGVLTAGNEREKFLAYMKKRYKIDSKKHNKIWSDHIEHLHREQKNQINT